MATIKTSPNNSGRFIITKVESGQRRVSCSCCLQGCCIYPAECGKGPSSVRLNGEIINQTEVDSLIYGNTSTGVILENGKWAVYRNGIRSERDCLGLQNPDMEMAQPLSVEANLASTYSFSFIYQEEAFTGNLEFVGGILEASPAVGAVGQCAWSGAVDQTSQDFDEGLALYFNKNECRWEVRDGPINEGTPYAYKDGTSTLDPTGSYSSEFAGISGFSIS